MYYMNKTKRNLILTSAILNIVGVTASLVVAILMLTAPEIVMAYYDYFYYAIGGYAGLARTDVGYLVITAIFFVVGILGSAFLIYSVRKKGKYFRTTRGLNTAGFIIIVVAGGWLAWLLLFISMFIPDIVVMNTPSEIRREERQENKAMEEKKRKIEELQALRDQGVITEEEYKERLFEIL